MNCQQSLEQVAGILQRADLTFDTSPDGRGYLVPFPAAAVYVTVGPWREGAVVTLTSPVLQEIDDEGPGAALVLNKLNKLNRRHRFLKFFYRHGRLVAAADLLGDGLTSETLLNVVFGMASVSARVAEKLAEPSGGLTYAQWRAEREECDGEGIDADDDIPF